MEAYATPTLYATTPRKAVDYSVNPERIADLVLDDKNVISRKAEIEQERLVAIGDLLRENIFAPVGINSGPYNLLLGVKENRLIFTITSPTMVEPHEIILPVIPFRGIIRDYFMICESYFDAVKSADPYKVEAVDMGRRGIHNEGSELLQTQLQDKVIMDFDTARRLFTLICVLHLS